MDGTAHFRLQGPDILVDDVAGDVVVVNGQTGSSYTITGPGAAVWHLLLAGHAVEAVAVRVACGHDATAAQALVAITPFIAALEAEGLLRRAASDAPRSPVPRTVIDGVWGPLVAPMLQKYGDLRDLLLLEPILDGSAPV